MSKRTTVHPSESNGLAMIASTPLRYCLALAAILAAPATLAADADNGERLARRWCASCHVVAPGQREAIPEAPPFETIAKAFGFNFQELVFFLLEPYPRMPSMALTRREADDIAAYIGKIAK